ncbi:MAG: lipocalin-like domain-containing protein [Lautropia sp.]
MTLRRPPFDLRLPVFAAPMFLISGPELVLAACRSGIIGAFPTPNARPIGVLDAWMKEITEGLARARDAQPAATIGPWCANLVTHSSNTRLAEDLELVAKYRPPVVVTALGSPKPVIEVVHRYGGLVFADVVNLTLARKAVAAGADGLACVSVGAGGHTGSLSPYAFVSAVRDFFDGYVIVGGGISDGYGVAGAIASGADFVYMGTRFIPTVESMAVPGFKQMVVDCTVDDLIVSAGLTGTPASWLRPSLQAQGIDPDNMPAAPARSYDSNREVPTRRWVDIWAAGQGLGTIRAIEPVATVVDRLVDQYRQAWARTAALATRAEPGAADNPLVGTWQLARWEISYGDGRPSTLPYGDAASGLIVYSDDGWMNACIGRGGRPRLSSESVRSAPEAERLAAFESFFQYAGRYTLRREAGRVVQVVHAVRQALNPNFVGSEQIRDVAFDGDGRLTLSGSDTVPGTSISRHHRLIWTRAGDARGG